MNGTTLAILAAIGAGVAVTLQAQMLGVLEQRIGPVAAATLTFASGGLVGLVILGVVRPDLSGWRTAPWWAWLGGTIGLGLIMGISFAIPRMGVTPTLTVVIASQVIVAAVLEQTGWLDSATRSLDAWRIGGLVLLLIGSWLVIR